MGDFSCIDWEILQVRRLYFQYVPQIFHQQFWPGNDPMLVENSPHVRLLQSFKQGKRKDVLMNSDYVRMQQYWSKIGYAGTSVKRDRKMIESKVDKFLQIYESIKKRGFFKKYAIEVLRKPLWLTRYKHEDNIIQGMLKIPPGAPGPGPEIYHGHHRAACCYVLGIRRIPSRILEDAKPGTMKFAKFDRKLKGVK